VATELSRSFRTQFKTSFDQPQAIKQQARMWRHCSSGFCLLVSRNQFSREGSDVCFLPPRKRQFFFV